MEEKVCFSFVILCAILSQGILAKFLETDVDESSELLVRQKRVVDWRPGKVIPLDSGDLPYVVNIKKRGRLHCVGSILSRNTVITAGRCIEHLLLSIFTVFSGSTLAYNGSEHRVTDRKLLGHDPPRTVLFMTGIALLTVNPPFVYSRTTASIDLHSGPVLTGMEGIVPGWGNCVSGRPRETQYSSKLRLVGVPIMNHRECQNKYHGYFSITEEEFCTYHPQKACGNTDIGAPFVIENELVGVHIGEILSVDNIPVKPDVFVLLQNLNYGPWIMRNIVH